MNRTLGLKMLVIGVVMGVILIALAMVNGTINERQQYRDDAVKSIEQSYAGPQTVIGPVLVRPYTQTTHTTTHIPPMSTAPAGFSIERDLPAGFAAFSRPVAVVTGLVGLASVFAMSRVYMLITVPAWNSPAIPRPATWILLTSPSSSA